MKSRQADYSSPACRLKPSQSIFHLLLFKVAMRQKHDNYATKAPIQSEQTSSDKDIKQLINNVLKMKKQLTGSCLKIHSENRTTPKTIYSKLS